jgi:AcrR family transcriptional regulator
MFFDPADYLGAAASKRSGAGTETRRAREARQRAKFCETMTRVVAEQGLAEASVNLVFRRARLGSSTYYKLYPDREACVLEAFERCATTILARVETAAGAAEGPNNALVAGIDALAAALASDPAVARLVAIDIRAGSRACREAQQAWLARLEMLVQSRLPNLNGFEEQVARFTVGGVATVLATEVAAGRTPVSAETLIAAGSVPCPP